MTSGLPPDTAERRRAGVLVPVAVPFAGWRPFFAVLLGTVLLSVVRGARRRTRCAMRPSAGHGKPPPGRNAAWRRVVGVPSPPQTQEDAGCSHIGRGTVPLERGRWSLVRRSRHDLRDRGQRGPVWVVVLRVQRVGIGGQFRRA